MSVNKFVASSVRVKTELVILRNYDELASESSESSG